MTTTYACAVTPSPYPRRASGDLTLTALHTAIRFFGLFAKYTVRGWGLRNLASAAERVAAELVARAVETTGNPDPHPRYTTLGELHLISIRLSLKAPVCLSRCGTGTQHHRTTHTSITTYRESPQSATSGTATPTEAAK